jgi:hypothetical protein
VRPEFVDFASLAYDLVRIFFLFEALRLLDHFMATGRNCRLRGG